MEFDLPYTEEVDYEAFLDHARKNVDLFTLVWRAGVKFSSIADDLKSTLSPFLIKEDKRNTWPGTESSGAPSLVSEYRVCEESIYVLGVVKDVWVWQSPNYPEDLAFYRKGKVVFASVAHEGMVWYGES